MNNTQSYKAEVIADNTGQWVGNGLRFETEKEAQAYVRDLQWRWTAVRDTRVVQSTEAPNNWDWAEVERTVDGEDAEEWQRRADQENTYEENR